MVARSGRIAEPGPAARRNRVVAVVLCAGILPALLSVAAYLVFGGERHVQEPLHECLELVGSCVALTVAMLLMMRSQHEQWAPHLLWAAAALVAMGIVDGVHSVAPFGLAWSWLRHGATFVGGMLFALVWVPLPALGQRRPQVLLLLILLSTVAGTILVWWRPERLPLPWGPTGYTFSVRATNALGGLGFVAAAVFFFRRYLRQPSTDDLVFASHTCLFGTASLLFGYSHLWSADWWAWHGFRLLAYSIILVAGHDVLTSLYRQVAHHAEELERGIKEETAALAAANQELEAFTYSVSHDLRAPLRAIAGFSEILMSEHAPQLDSEAQHYLAGIERNAAQMRSLINDLLDLSRLSRQVMRAEAVDLLPLVRDAFEVLRPAMESREIEIVITELPRCQADPALLRQVFVNLLSNAVKYTRHQAKARIEVGVLTGDGKPVYYVRDNGVGFDMKYAVKLFGVFQRFHRPEEYEGTGVGLAIVQRIIQRHGGRIWADAAPGRGATFFFTLGRGVPQDAAV